MEISKYLIDQFKECVAREPERPALVFGESIWSRKELYEHSQLICSYLNQSKKDYSGNTPRVVLQLDQPQYMIASIIGSMLANVTFVPTNPQWPLERTARVIQRLNPNWILKSEIFLQNQSSEIHTEFQFTNPVAYMMFTSGSTGEPKGVPISYNAWSQFAATFPNILCGNRSNEEIISFHEFSFDASLVGITLLLIGKGCLHYVPPKSNALDLVDYIKEKKITCLTSVPSTFDLLLINKKRISPGALDSLKSIGIGGATFFTKTAKGLTQLAPNASIYNMYGPTEATIWCSLHEVSPNDFSAELQIPIGRPLEGTEFLFDLGEKKIAANPNTEGELLIAGRQLMEGYLDGAEKGLEEIKWNDKLKVVYRSGDYFHEKNGEIYFSGRKSGFLKTSGHRISPTEIEEAYATHPSIAECALVGLPDAIRENILVLFYNASEEIEEKLLTEYGKVRLPIYSLPHQFILLHDFPRTESNKIDYKALRKIAAEALEL